MPEVQKIVRVRVCVRVFKFFCCPHSGRHLSVSTSIDFDSCLSKWCIQHPDTNRTGYFWTKSGQTDSGQPFFQKIPTESRQRTGSRQKNPDRQTQDSIFSKNLDRIRTADKIETDKIRTDRHLTENPDRTRTADRHRTRFSGKCGQKRDKDRTRTVLSADVCNTGNTETL